MALSRSEIAHRFKLRHPGYYRRYRDRARLRAATYYSQNREPVNERRRAHYAANRPAYALRARDYYVANRAKILSRVAAYAASNHELVLARLTQWRADHLDEVRRKDRARMRENVLVGKDFYVRRRIVDGTALQPSMVPASLVRAKRENLKLKRICKKIKQP